MKNYPKLAMAVGLAIEELRKEKRLTKTMLSIRADLEDCYVRGITKGRKNPSLFALQSICEALDVSLIELIKRVDIDRENNAH